MNRKQLNNIKKYLDFLQQQIGIDSIENTDEQYDKNIWFFSDQYDKIFNVLHTNLEEYSVDIKALIEDKYILEYCDIMYKALDLCLKGELGMPKIYVDNKENKEGIMNILNKIKENIKIDFFESWQHGIIYVEGQRKYLDLISRHINTHPVYRNFNKKLIEYCKSDFSDAPCKAWCDHYDETNGHVEDNWCYNHCSKKLLLIDTRDYVTADQYIEKCFEDQ